MNAAYPESSQPASFTLISTEARCPRCGGSFVRLAESPVLLSRCSECGGAWIDKRGWFHVDEGRLNDMEKAFFEREIDRGAHPNQGAFREPAPPGDRLLACPVCEVELTRHHVVDANADVFGCGEHGAFLPSAAIRPVWQAADMKAAVEVQAVKRREREGTLPGHFVLVLAGCMWVLSMCLPALKFSIIGPPSMMFGIQAALFGIPFYPSNILAMVTFITHRSLRGVYGWIMSVLMFLSGIGAAWFGAATNSNDLMVGYFVWTGSFFVLGAATLVRTLGRA